MNRGGSRGKLQSAAGMGGQVLVQRVELGDIISKQADLRGYVLYSMLGCGASFSQGLKP